MNLFAIVGINILMEKRDFPFWRRQKKKCIQPVYDVNELILIKGALGSNSQTGCLLNVVLKICTGTTGFYSFIKLKTMCLDIYFLEVDFGF